MKAYPVIDLLIQDLDGCLSYVNRIPSLIERDVGQYLVEGVVPKVVEGKVDEGHRLVLLEFRSIELAESFLSERAASGLLRVWADTTQSRILLAEGKAP